MSIIRPHFETKIVPTRDFKTKVYATTTDSVISKDRVKINRYMREVKCKDTVWANDIYVDSNYSIWLNPFTHVYPEYVPYEPIKIIRLEDSSFVVDLMKCENDYEWVMYDNTDFGLQGYYPVKQITYQRELRQRKIKK